MLKKSDLFLKLLWIISEEVLGEYVLFFSRRDRFALIVIETGTSVLRNNLGRIIEEHSC